MGWRTDRVAIHLKGLKELRRKHIIFLGFDHSLNDRRILKDVGLLKDRYNITYIYRSNQFEHPTVKQGVNYIGLQVKKEKSRIFRRFIFENEMTNKALDLRGDYYYLHGMFITFPIFFLRKLNKTGPVIYDAHEFDLEPIFLKNPLLRKLVSLFLLLRQKSISKEITSSFTVSPSILEFMQKWNFKNVLLKMNISDVPLVRPKPLQHRKPILVIAGNISKERGVGQFLEIFKKMLEKENSLTLHLHCHISDPKLEKQLKEWIAFNLPHDSVVFGAFLPYEKLIEKLSCSLASVMAFPSDGSITNKIALPNRFFDSLSAGTPIIASKDSIDVAKFINEQKIGWLFDPEDPDGDILQFFEEFSNKKSYEKKLANVSNFAGLNNIKSINDALNTVF